MNWQTLFSNRRVGSSQRKEQDHIRGDYMRDYDRLIFSSQFRRLQNKTQVFPLPGAVFVHNRLTHSLEVASVGRSLGRAVGERIADKYQNELDANALDFYRFELPAVVMTACIAHDIGNPPFGHSGEDAIRSFFREIEGESKAKLEAELTENQLNDFRNFEGNANAFRILTTIFKNIGLKLTFTTLASIIKYPSDSTHGFDKSKGIISTKKSGFFDSEIPYFKEIAEQLEIHAINEAATIYARHPFVYLVEAADDICYRIIDLEDAHRLSILSTNEAIGLLLPFFEGEDSEAYIKTQMEVIDDDRQKLSLLRAMLINLLSKKCTEVFIENEEILLNGLLNKPLLDLLDERTIGLIKKIDEISFQKIYKHPSVLEIEIAGYRVIVGLLSEFVSAVLQPHTTKSKMLLRMFPPQFRISETASLYTNLLQVIDYVSGMTDIYAVELYRKIMGIEMPQLRS
jgi:dGTPase